MYYKPCTETYLFTEVTFDVCLQNLKGVTELKTMCFKRVSLWPEDIRSITAVFLPEVWYRVGAFNHKMLYLKVFSCSAVLAACIGSGWKWENFQQWSLGEQRVVENLFDAA